MSDFELLGPDTISFSNVSVYGNLEEDFSQDYLESHLGTDRTLQSGHERVHFTLNSRFQLKPSPSPDNVAIDRPSSILEKK